MEEVISLIRIYNVMLRNRTNWIPYIIIIINSVTEELNGNRSVWWLMNNLLTRIETVNVEVLISICPMKKRGELQGGGIVYILRRALIIPDKRVVYMHVVSIVAYQDYQDRCRPHKRRSWIFTHMDWSSAHAHNIVQEVEVHGWLLSGIERIDYTCTCTLLLSFDSCS